MSIYPRKLAFYVLFCALVAACLLVGVSRYTRFDVVGAARSQSIKGNATADSEVHGTRTYAPTVAPFAGFGPVSAQASPPPISGAPPGVVSSSKPSAPPTLADILAESGDLGIAANRQRAVERMQAVERASRADAVDRARRAGLPLRVERPDGTVQEIAAFEGDRPVYFTTYNVNAAISTGANILQGSDYGLSGAGVTVGVWDGGSARVTHQEFATATGGRITVKDGSASIDHATHVSGTIAAAGVDGAARGMAPAALVDSYDWNGDKSEMAARAATAPNQAGMLYFSNHSYGYVGGWNYVNGGSPSRVWEWYGDGTSAAGYEYDFGRYNTYSRDSDALAYSAPYFLMFRSAGNDRADNPSPGQAVALAPGSSTVVSYDATLQPAGDGTYRSGFETICFDALGKNVVTVGSVSDAVTNGLRDTAKASVSYFSCWGPTDDGRIKPDVVANGDALYSSLNGGDASYGVYSGTSMATPNALGTAVLLFEDYARLFPGGAMRASTLKGLLIHTADDLGNPGPDYKYGWGLINAKAACDLLRDHAANPLKVRLTEDVVTTARSTVNLDFVWDGVTPIRATLSWTDPAGTATTTNDLRTPRLINNLDLKIVGPTGAEYLPYVMPFVGTWTQASMDVPATVGKNTTDNVEQVYLPAPPTAGVYRCVVSLAGTLTNSEQRYALLITGAANVAPPPPPLTISAISPPSALSGSVSFTLTGTGFDASTVVKLRRAGSVDITATGLQLVNGILTGQLNLAAAPPGLWDVVATNADAKTYTSAAAFTVQTALWSESFDGTVSGWTSQATTGSNAWAIATAQSYSPLKSYFAAAPATKSTCNLSTPAIAVPAAATGLQFKFWHRFDLQSGRDGGRLEFAVDGGAWYDVTASGSGAAFSSNGYTTTLSQNGSPNNRSDFAGLRAWSGSSGGFIETILNLTDTAKYSGHTLRARWLLATDASTSSAGWYLDNVALIGGGAVNYAPVIVGGPVSSSTETVTDPDGTFYYVIRGTSTVLSVVATDDGGEGLVTYTWTAVSAATPPVSFSSNAVNAAKNTTATFEGSGNYAVTVAVRDALGMTTSGVVNVRVLPEASALNVAPAAASVMVGGEQVFTATVLDQFGLALATQPGSYVWNASGGGTITASGAFSATTAGGPYAVIATSGNYTATASVTVNPAAATVTLSNLTQVYDGQPKPVGIVTTPANLAVAVTYDGAGIVPVAVGSYAVSAAVIDPNYQGSASGTLVIQPRQFTLTLAAAPAEGGSVSGSGTFDEGMTLPVSAVPAGGWRFTGWTGAVPLDPAATTTTITMDADHSLVATFVAKTGYELWADAHTLSGATADPLSDADGDGLANLLEYATAGDPTQPTPSTLHIEVVNGALTFAFPRIADPSLVYTVEASDDPGGPWTALAVEGNPSTGARNLAGLVVFTDSLAPADQPRRFLRLRVSY